jgi:molybdate transport system substrate-binding protein
VSTSSSSCLDYRIAPAGRAFAAFALACTLLWASTAAAPAQAPAREIHVAAAGDLEPVLPLLAAAYEHATGVKIVASFGSSAALAQKLEHGDPEDVFLADDYAHPEQLVAAGLAASRTPIPYARGVLVLWARHDSPAQPLTLESLSSPRVTRIAVADELDQAYGLAASRALSSLGLTTRLAGKLDVAENLTAAAQLAESGKAQLAIIPLSLAGSPRLRQTGNYVRFPATSYPEIRQCAVILKASKNQAPALLFLNWLTSYAVQHNLTQVGLDPIQ